jgi:putative phosphoribosyl transferase
VVVAAEVAPVLGAPLDVLVVRKLGVPGHEELGMGAVAEGGTIAVNRELLRRLGIDDTTLEAVRQREVAEVERRRAAYRGGRPAIPLQGRAAIVVDDGLATGYTARAALREARRRGAERVVLAVPVAARQSLEEIADEADETVAVVRPAELWAVGQWYHDFRQTTDEEVVRASHDG